MRLIQETPTGLVISDGRGWRDPMPGEFIDTGDGNYLSLNSEAVNVACIKCFVTGVLLTAAVVMVAACVMAEAMVGK